MATLIQRSFSGGEIAPSLYARVDVNRYATSARILRNFYTMRHGGAANRQGTQFIAQVKDSSKKVRLIPFVFNVEQTYVLEFGENYIRFYRGGIQLSESALTITGITNANPGVVTTSAPHGYSNGDEVQIFGVEGMTEVNGRNFKISAAGGSTFELRDNDGTTAIDTTSFGAYSSGGFSAKVFELASTYLEADLPELKFVQSGDVITLVHPKYPVKELSRVGPTDLDWTLTEVTFAPEQPAPSGVAVAALGGGNTVTYGVTAVNDETFEESLVASANSPPTAVDPPTVANPHTITWVAAAGATTYNIYKSENGVFGFVGIAQGTQFVSNGTLLPDFTDTSPGLKPTNPFADFKITAVTNANPGVVTFTPDQSTEPQSVANGDLITITGVQGMTELNGGTYLANNVTNTTLELQDTQGVNLDTTSFGTYTSGGDLGIGQYPSTVTYFQQRLMFANLLDNVEIVHGSKTGNFKNFSVSTPIQDDDAISFTMAGRQVNEVRHLFDLGQLLIFTSAGEWSVQGDESGILKPTGINPRQNSYNGASSLLSPIAISSSALYVQARGSIVRDFGFDFASDTYKGSDLSIFSAHLFDNFQLNDWAYSQVPHSIVWVVRDDGTLLGLTFVREQELVSWHRHDFTNGTAENITSVPENNEDIPYLVIKRTIDGVTRRYIERFSSREFDETEIKDVKFMDSFLTFDGRNTAATTMTLTSPITGTWTNSDTLTLTSSVPFFVAGDVGNQIQLFSSSGDVIRFSIEAFTSTTIVTGKPHKNVPAELQVAATTNWAKAVDMLSGLWHLEGQDVSVFGDGFVVASPNNAAHVTVTVSNGSITLEKPFAVIHVGLPITADIETLDIDTPSGETLIDKRKKVGHVTLFVEKSRGIWVGQKPTGSDPLEGLTEAKVRNDEGYEEPVDLRTGTVEVINRSEWNRNGRVFIRQVDPVPLSVLAVAPEGQFPFRGGGG